MKLEQERIVAAALALVNREGLSGFNLRALALMLNVRASALYWHVGSKDEIVARMAKMLYERAFDAAPKGVGWQGWLLGFGRAFRASLLGQRDSAQICTMARLLDTNIPTLMERIAAPMVEGGIDKASAVSMQGAVIAYTLGWVVYEQSSTLHDTLEQMYDFTESYERGLTAMVRGFAADRSKPP
ncbi:MAG: TetR/AcrR family transcriptional regulator C-terminal domain-containing protein [Alphaproteobacteria bacterium]|nr:TetR/AcrR family transcriptional regulator C-terminal domain-containing protein [Alphaproteobacteria bacterium]MDE2013376.1 TetR/AcrR family transcriptional regulator C-terminal domain-containing protein [Alphaproteobacteria bacterium]MDE2352269.1 TetR/AcrR family transcriptional regulator C-terminal domain-containing protein [Alphaproteobacteria bacterium]